MKTMLRDFELNDWLAFVAFYAAIGVCVFFGLRFNQTAVQRLLTADERGTLSTMVWAWLIAFYIRRLKVKS